MKQKSKITAVAGVAVCSFVSVINAGQVAPNHELNSENMNVLKSAAPHPYTNMIEAGKLSAVEKHNYLEVIKGEKRSKHLDTDNNDSIWDRLINLFRTSSSGSDNKLV